MSDSGKTSKDSASNPPAPGAAIQATGPGSLAIGGNVTNSEIHISVHNKGDERTADDAEREAPLRQNIMKKSYSAVILGEERGVYGYDEHGNLLLSDGQRFKIVPLSLKPDTFRSLKIRAVSKLTFTGGEWLLDGEPFESHWGPQFNSPPSSARDTRIYTIWKLREILSENRPGCYEDEYPRPADLRKQVSAVAWVEERFEDYPGQEPSPPKAFEPVFLSSFYKITDAAAPALPPVDSSNRTDTRPLPHAVQKSSPSTALAQRRFRVALSFPGERREFVARVAAALGRALGQERVFYDEFYEAELARPDLDLYLGDIYREQADLVVPFYCADYERKKWCRLEWRQMREILFTLEGHRIMPFRFDDSPISGVLSLDGYVKIGDRSPQEIAKLILQRLASG
ncbi:hypothetical protein SBV1_2490019 [Verrucomicrobia bacterium]|nr:hypothetical protein SBV1_2490019 [Verrucomicrobiota bacterium]